MKSISKQELAALRKNYLADPSTRIVRNAMTEHGVEKIARTLEAVNDNPNLFSIDLETMPVTNQKASGRCWIFSALNLMRELIAKRYHIKTLELSQNFIAFYDKLEKVNWFMNCALEEIDEPLNSRTMTWLLDNGISDGGQWDMVVSLIKSMASAPRRR